MLRRITRARAPASHPGSSHARSPIRKGSPTSRRASAAPTSTIALIIALGLGAAFSGASALPANGRVTAGPDTAATPTSQDVGFEIQSLDGQGNNRANPTWGIAGAAYSREAPAWYADGRSQPLDGPNARYVSNRVFNDAHQNLFSETNVTQWGFAWGQFLDHTFGLRRGRAPGDPEGETQNIAFDSTDPIEEFDNDLGVIPFVRSDAAAGTGVDNPREQVNTVSSYIDTFAVYGGTVDRLEWIRSGPVDGNLNNNSAQLMIPGGYLPRRDARGDADTAPIMEIDGFLRGREGRAAVAGDIRANENLGLLATQTLFAREHNRIVGMLPAGLSEEQKFQIARRIVIAEQQYITYTEFLPALGVRLSPYQGYRSGLNTDLSNEFATVGYRAHSMIHGELELEAEADRYGEDRLAEFERLGIEVVRDGDEVELVIPLNLAFFNPDLLEQVELGPMLQGLGLEAQYRNEEQIDNQLRSVLFQIPVPGNLECLDGPELPECFDGVVDLGAIDIERGRDHGIPRYNELRAAYGLPAKSSFPAITGEGTEAFPPGIGIDDPTSLEFTRLIDVNGNDIPLDHEDADGDAVDDERRSTVAARLNAIYGSVDRLDAFTGMLAEPRPANGQLGELQNAIWKREFERLRDGDRFFYANDPGLSLIRQQYGIDYRSNLGDIIAANTDIGRADLSDNVFFVDGEEPPTSCAVEYRVNGEWPDGFNAQIRVINTGSTPISDWSVRWSYADGQTIVDHWDTELTDGRMVRAQNAPWNRVLSADGGSTQFGLIGTHTGVNRPPTSVSLNTTRCTLR